MTDTAEIKIKNILNSSTFGKYIELSTVAKIFEDFNFNNKPFSGLVYELKTPKTIAFIFGLEKLVITGLKYIDKTIKAINTIISKIISQYTHIPKEFNIIQNIIELKLLGIRTIPRTSLYIN